MVVVILSDANLASAQQPFPRPKFDPAWLAPPTDQNAVPAGLLPYDWDEQTGLARRFVPGQPNGMHTLTGLAHDKASRVAYDPEINQDAIRARSLKLAAFQKTLRPPTVFGEPTGDLLVVGWGSTQGAIEEAVQGLQAEGRRVSAMHFRFLQPLPPGIGDILKGFQQVVTVEASWATGSRTPSSTRPTAAIRRWPCSCARAISSMWIAGRRYAGQPIKPGSVRRVVLNKLGVA